MRYTLANDTIGILFVWIFIPLFIGIRSYLKRRNGTLAIATALFAFSICHIIGETILPIPFYCEANSNFQLEQGIIYPNFNESLVPMLMKSTVFFCYYLIFVFFLRSLFCNMQKFWKAFLIITFMLSGSIVYFMARNLLHGDIVAYLNLNRVTMELFGGLIGYFLSYLLEKVNPSFYAKINLTASPKVERANQMMDLN